ncbi:MAG: DNA repair protein RecN [Armatimonadetes bacterium]|nr:DNA repair protein RecN [Armatimonadota bacterium]
MLTRLHVHNFALIDHVEIDFAPGLNVLTGETGAGKSILIDAMTAALGERATADWVRTGADRALIEVAFEVDPNAVGTAVEEWTEEGIVILSREIAASGRSVARLNGRLCTAAALRDAARHLIDIHGQHEHQSLLHPERHVEFLDAWVGDEALCLRRQAAELYAALREARTVLEDLRRSERERAQRLDLYRFQMEEIGSARLRPGEEEELLADRSRLANAEKLFAGAGAVRELLTDGEIAATDLLGQAARELSALAVLDPGLNSLVEDLETAWAAAQEVARSLRGYQEGIEFNPERLEQVQERLGALRQLKRKYGDTIQEILSYREKIAAELCRLERGEERAGELEREITARIDALNETARALYDLRLAAADHLAGEIRGHLGDLGMQRTRFRVAVEPPRLAEAEVPDGLAGWLGRVEFLISPNPGEPERALVRIASGGELSRVMLALKSAMADASPVRILIFDEIDAGVGGHTATVLGRKLRDLARGNQILCVTHLPPVASAADTHLVVQKRTRGERTSVTVRRLNEEERVGELARMLGGSQATATEHARQLLATARTDVETPVPGAHGTGGQRPPGRASAGGRTH